MSVQNMEPSAEQYRLASMLDASTTADQEKETEQKIQKVVEFTGCNNDKAAIALFDTDFNVEAACLKILESADNEADDDTWGKVEKPQKKAPNRDDKMDKFGNDFQVSGSRGGSRGRAAFRGGGRGDFRGGRGGGAPRGKSYHEGGRFPDRSSGYGEGQYQGKRDFNQRGGGARGGGAYRGGGQRGAYRGRSEPPRGGGANNRGYKGGMRQHQVVSHHHAGSDSGSDWGDNKNEPEWGKTEKWESKKRDQPAVRQQQHQPQRSRVDSSGWDEPESLNAQNWNDTNKQQSNRKVDAWREKENDDGWNDEAESWGEKTKQTTQTKSDWNKTLEWEEDQPVKQQPQQGWTDDEPKAPVVPPQQQQAAKQAAATAVVAPAPIQQSQQQQAQTDHLDRIFSKNVNILDTQKNISSSTTKPHRKEEKSIPQTNQLPPGFQTSRAADVLSFGRSPERGGRRAPPPIRSSINHPRQAVEMPSMVNDMPTAQFCFGSFPEQRNDDHIEPPKEYTNGESKSVSYPTQTHPHPNTATSPPDQSKDLDHGLPSYHIPTREKAERDLRKMLNQPSSKDSSHSSNMGGVVPGLINPVQPSQATNSAPLSTVGSVQRPSQTSGLSPPTVKNEHSSSLPSAPGQGRIIDRASQNPPTQSRPFQPSISSADMGLHYGNISSNPTYDILHPMGQRPISSRPDDQLRSSSQQPPQAAPQMNSQYQAYQHTPMQPFYANLGMPYYPVIGQRNPNAFQPMSSYQPSSMGATNSSDSLRGGMRTSAQDIATPPPFGTVPNLSPHTYPSGVAQHPSAQVAFPQLLIQQPTAGSLGGQHINMGGHHQQDNRGPRQNL